MLRGAAEALAVDVSAAFLLLECTSTMCSSPLLSKEEICYCYFNKGSRHRMHGNAPAPGVLIINYCCFHISKLTASVDPRCAPNRSI